MEKQVFSSYAYDKPHSKEFLDAAKHGDLYFTRVLILTNRFLVYAFDETHKTALHWACKASHVEVCTFLISYHADVDAEDSNGCTPIYFALKSSNLKLAMFLLEKGANPFSNKTANIQPLINSVPEYKDLFDKFRKIIICMNLMRKNDRDVYWKKQIEMLQYVPDGNEEPEENQEESSENIL